MSSSTKAIFGKQVLHKIFAEDYIDWSGEMLMQDHDSPNLRILAGLDRRSSIFEVEEYFLRSIKELNIKEVEPKTAVRAYACEILKQHTKQHIIDGKLTSLRDAIRAMYEIWLDTNYDSEYAIWVELDDALDSLGAGEFPYTYPSATLENFDEIVRTETDKFLAKMAS